MGIKGVAAKPLRGVADFAGGTGEFGSIIRRTLGIALSFSPVQLLLYLAGIVIIHLFAQSERAIRYRFFAIQQAGYLFKIYGERSPEIFLQVACINQAWRCPGGNFGQIATVILVNSITGNVSQIELICDVVPG